jgi:hypothetical protein
MRKMRFARRKDAILMGNTIILRYKSNRPFPSRQMELRMEEQLTLVHIIFETHNRIHENLQDCHNIYRSDHHYIASPTMLLIAATEIGNLCSINEN